MSVPLLHRTLLDAASRAALAGVLADPTFELLPVRSIDGQLAALPAGASVSVTASPSKGPEATVELAARLAAAGFRAVPHLAARSVRDRAHLRTLLTRLADAGLDRIFLVGGDALEPGEFPDGLALLRAMADAGSLPTEIGIPCYPDGHGFIADEAIAAALRDKAPFASYMTTQMCFDAALISRWIADRRREGLALPVVIGIPGVTEPHRLLAISARIGVRDTRRFLAKNLALLRRLVRSGGFYRPAGLLERLGPTLADPAMQVRGIHLYTFNSVAATEGWRVSYLERLAQRR